MLKDPLVEQYIETNSAKLGLDLRQVQRFINLMERMQADVDVHNERFISRKLKEYKGYFDGMLNEVDPDVLLDQEQRRAVLTDDDHCLLIAGAGAGKTTTMAAKVKYLVDKLGISPDDIIVISYTNKAVDELRERICVKLGIPARVTTFHAFGYDLLKSQRCASRGQCPCLQYNIRTAGKKHIPQQGTDEKADTFLRLLFRYTRNCP